MVGRVLGVFVGLVTVVACSGAPQAPSAIDRPGVATEPADPVTTSLVGTYSATLALPACTGLPEAERVRHYSAGIERDETTGVHVVTLSGATFLDTLPSQFHPVPMTANQFLASQDAGVASFTLWGDWESSFGGHIIERTSSG